MGGVQKQERTKSWFSADCMTFCNHNALMLAARPSWCHGVGGVYILLLAQLIYNHQYRQHAQYHGKMICGHSVIMPSCYQHAPHDAMVLVVCTYFCSLSLHTIINTDNMHNIMVRWSVVHSVIMSSCAQLIFSQYFRKSAKHDGKKTEKNIVGY